MLRLENLISTSHDVYRYGKLLVNFKQFALRLLLLHLGDAGDAPPPPPPLTPVSGASLHNECRLSVWTSLDNSSQCQPTSH